MSCTSMLACHILRMGSSKEFIMMSTGLRLNMKVVLVMLV